MPGSFPGESHEEVVAPAPVNLIDASNLISCRHCHRIYVSFSGSYGVCAECGERNRDTSTEFWEECTDPDCLCEPDMVPHHTWVFGDSFEEEVYQGDASYVCLCPICRQNN